MQVNVLKTESKLMGRNMLRIHEWETAGEILHVEADIISRYNPAYIYLEVDATDLYSMHQLEDNGYSFSEFRIRTRLNTSDLDISTRSFFPFKMELIGEEELYEKAVEILMTSHDDDRFSNDPLIGHQFSKDRLVANLRKSFTAYPKEFLLGLINSNTDALIGFRSGAFISNTEAIYYQYGIASGYDHDHTANMLEAFTIDFLKNRGIGIINAVSTGYNIAVLNNLIKNNDFVIASSSVLMRKVFD
jgi:hypothetical protein